MREATLVRQIKAALEAGGAWVMKVHGGPYQAAGIPDLIVCVSGELVALEVKTPKRRSNVSALQKATMEAIERAGGEAYVVTSVEEAGDAVFVNM